LGLLRYLTETTPDATVVGGQQHGGQVDDEQVNDEGIKVTDRRMFTADGQLREEYRFLEDRLAAKEGAEGAAAEPSPAAPSQPAPSPPGPSQPGPSPSAPPPPPAAAPAPPVGEVAAAGAGRIDLPDAPPGFGAPGFLDLVSVLAEPATIYLGEAPLPDGSSGEDLEMARLYIDLLGVLRQKTLGNLTPQESAVLEDLVYRLRVRFVQKRG
jgi:Domain of unknown function (DUF1844)